MKIADTSLTDQAGINAARPAQYAQSVYLLV